jgi:hypothetical protein
MENKVLEILKEHFGNRLILRRHPIMKNEKKGDFRYDEDYDMWELVVAERITNNNILISSYSTAQMTPKLLFGKEPRVVFLYNILSPQKNIRLEQSYTDFNNLYCNAQRVIAPKTIEELTAFLEQS